MWEMVNKEYSDYEYIVIGALVPRFFVSIENV